MFTIRFMKQDGEEVRECYSYEIEPIEPKTEVTKDTETAQEKMILNVGSDTYPTFYIGPDHCYAAYVMNSHGKTIDSRGVKFPSARTHAV